MFGVNFKKLDKPELVLSNLDNVEQNCRIDLFSSQFSIEFDNKHL